MNLLLTLGHNSSAILVDSQGFIICGFETERFTHNKSDSSFPIEVIEEFKQHIRLETVESIFVSHWFPDGKLPNKDTKHWRPSYIKAAFPRAKVYSVSQDFTHHDAHAYSAIAFSKDHMPHNESTHILVMDGFGNFGETMSLYRFDAMGIPVLQHRTFGYGTSLGLFYQYATSFVGMRENQDEYKMLGYEAKVSEYSSDTRDTIKTAAIEVAKQFLKKQQIAYDENTDPMLLVGALAKVKLEFNKVFASLLKALDITSYTSTESKIVISYFAQTVIEEVVKSIISVNHIDNIILAGGLFLNVKLNNIISYIALGKTSIMPLSGDQGAALGLYHYYSRDLRWPGHLYWGIRHLDIHNIPRDDQMVVANTYMDAVIVISSLLSKNKIVNIVRGAMEFGPRALGNTSTLALPTKENVEYINRCNERSTIMPMAPVMTVAQARDYLHDINNIVQSLGYMVCTRVIKENKYHKIEGGAHTSPDHTYDTARVQITNDRLLVDILRETGPLINTSFNEHGKPICFEMNDVIRCHEFQRARDEHDRIYTVIIRN